jgi:DNA polymerase-1
MMGDAVDNIPGLDGVGEKTAKKFIQEFGSMENLLSQYTYIKELKEKVEASAERGFVIQKVSNDSLRCTDRIHRRTI